MSENVKVLRGQVRQVAKEMLTEELQKLIEEKVIKSINERLDRIEKRQKDHFGFLIRNTTLGSVK